MFCGKCDTQVEDDALFCPNCGSKIEHAEPEDDYSKTMYAGADHRFDNYRQNNPVQPNYQNQNYQNPGNPNRIQDEFGGPGYDINEMNGGKKNNGLVMGLLIGGIILAVCAIGFVVFMNKEKAPKTTTYYVTGAKDNSLKIEDEDGDKLTTVETFDTVEVVDPNEDETDWKVYLKDEKKYGYVDSRFLTKDEDNATKRQQLFVKEDDTALYEERDDEDSKHSLLSKATVVDIIAQYDDQRFVYVEDSKKYGYVAYEDLTDVLPITKLKTGYGDPPAEKTKTYYVNAGQGNQLPLVDENGSVIDKLDYAKEVQVISKDNDLWYVYANEMYGFVDKAGLVDKKPQDKTYLSYRVDTAKTTRNGSFLSVRDDNLSNNYRGKITSGEVQVQLKDGEIVKKQGASTHASEGYVDYYYVYVPDLGIYGYVNSLYILPN